MKKLVSSVILFFLVINSYSQFQFYSYSTIPSKYFTETFYRNNYIQSSGYLPLLYHGASIHLMNTNNSLRMLDSTFYYSSDIYSEWGITFQYDSILKIPTSFKYHKNNNLFDQINSVYNQQTKTLIQTNSISAPFVQKTVFDNLGRIIVFSDSGQVGETLTNTHYITPDSVIVKELNLSGPNIGVDSAITYCRLNNNGFLEYTKQISYVDTMEKESKMFFLLNQYNQIDSTYSTFIDYSGSTGMSKFSKHYYSGLQIDSVKTKLRFNKYHTYFNYNSYALIDKITSYSLTFNNDTIFYEYMDFFYKDDWLSISEDSMNKITAKLFPNPNQGKFNLKITSEKELNKVEILLFNTLGEAIDINVQKVNENEFKLNTKKFKGLGILSINGQYAGKVEVY